MHTEIRARPQSTCQQGPDQSASMPCWVSFNFEKNENGTTPSVAFLDRNRKDGFFKDTPSASLVHCEHHNTAEHPAWLCFTVQHSGGPLC